MKLILSPNAKLISAFLLKVVAVLLFFGLLSSYAENALGYDKDKGFLRLFDLGREANIPALYSTFAIWFCALLLWQIYTAKKGGNKREAIQWKVMCFVFLFLGFDELLLIHERTKGISTFVASYIQVPIKDLYWTISYGLLLIPFAVYFFRFYWQLPKATRIRFTIAGIVYVGGAIGIEILGGMYVKQVLNGSYNPPVGLPAFGYDLLVATEEIMEMVGIVLFIRALLIYIRNMPSYPVITLHLGYRSNENIGLGQLHGKESFFSNVNTFSKPVEKKEA